MTSDLERKVGWLMAVEGIKTTIAKYAKAGDEKNDPAMMRSLMVEDATWEAPGFGKYEGRDVIAEGLAKIAEERILWSLHFPVAPIIEVSDDQESAHAFWWLWELLSMRGDDGKVKDNWLGATYEADFVKRPDGWKIKKLHLNVQKIVPYVTPPA